MNSAQLKIGKIGLILYWISVVVTYFLYFDTTVGYYHAMGGAVIFAVHILEIGIFNKALKKYSDNVTMDSFRILIFGFLVPTELKLKSRKKE